MKENKQRKEVIKKDNRENRLLSNPIETPKWRNFKFLKSEGKNYE